MKQLTVKKLEILCKEMIKSGYGNYPIYISDDDEGNGYHGLYFGFTELDEDIDETVRESNYKVPNKYVILG